MLAQNILKDDKEQLKLNLRNLSSKSGTPQKGANKYKINVRDADAGEEGEEEIKSGEAESHKFSSYGPETDNSWEEHKDRSKDSFDQISDELVSDGEDGGTGGGGRRKN